MTPQKTLQKPYSELLQRTAALLQHDVRSGTERTQALQELEALLFSAQEQSQPLEELFPEGFDAFYRDLTASLPAYSGEDKIRQLRRRRLIRGAVAVFLLLLIALSWLKISGRWDLHREGLSYLQNRVDRYVGSVTEAYGVCELEIDLRDPESNIGKTVYEQDGCKIEVSALDFQMQDGYPLYRIFFRSTGRYALDGGKLVSFQRYTAIPGQGKQIGISAVPQLCHEGQSYDCHIAGSGYSKTGDITGFYLIPSLSDISEEARSELQRDIEEAGSVTLRISGLAVNIWEPYTQTTTI